MVSRSTIAVSFVVVLVLFSGCSALLGGGPSDPSEFDYAAGFSADGISDGQQALDSYKQSLQEEGDYTGEYGYVIVTNDGETDVNVTYRVDFEAKRAIQRAVVEAPSANGTTESYYEADQLYQRSSFQGSQSGVSVRQQAFSNANLTAAEAIRPLLLNASEYSTSLEERDGETMVRYETDSIEGADDILGVKNVINVTSFQASFLVDSDGIVHEATYDLSYFVDTDSGPQERSVSMTFELSAIGETTVERPSWADDA